MLRRLLSLLVIPSMVVAACSSQQTVQITPTDTPAPTATVQELPRELISVLTNRYNSGRTGANLQETVLNHTTVNPDQFGKLFTREVVGDVYAQPLYVPQVEIPGKGIHNVVYVATMHNMVYAFDADDPNQSEPLWEVNLGTPFTTKISTDIPGGEDGILSTPVIDAKTQTIYLVSRNQENERVVHKLHALDITTGEPKFGSPKEIQLTVSGNGDGNINGQIRLDSANQLQRAGLLLEDGNVYLGFGSSFDWWVWYGWLAAYDASNIQNQTGLFHVTPNGYGGGIWMSGAGITSDGGHLYLVAANGTFTANVGGTDYGMSVLKLRHSNGTFNVADYFTPSNEKELTKIDSGLGSSGVVLIPNTDFLVTGGKDGNLYMVNRDQLGHFDPTTNSNTQTFFQGNGRIYVTPVFWQNGPENRPSLYAWNEFGYIKAYTLYLAAGRFITEPSSESSIETVGLPAGSLSLSANGSDPTSGILWALYAPSADAGDRTGVLVALNAMDLKDILWHSEMNSDRDSVGTLSKFNPATVANGKVYVASFSNRLNVYGLLDNGSQ